MPPFLFQVILRCALEDNNLTAGSIFPEGSRIFLGSEDGGRTQYWARREGNHVKFETWEDIDTLLDANRAEQVVFSRNSRKAEMMKVASVPTSLKLQWDREQRSPEDIKRILNDPDYAKLRTTDPKWRV